MVEVAETLETKLKRHEDALVACMAEITRLREENSRLRCSENSAHNVLKEIYNDPAASPNVRVLAAKAAIGHESAPLKPQPAPLELTAEVIEPLSVVVERQRARCDRWLAMSLEERERMITGVVRKDGNGASDREQR